LSGQIYLGADFGINESKIRYDDEDYQKSFKHFQKFKKGYSGGITSLLYFSEVLDLKANLFYTQKGMRYLQTYSYNDKTLNYAQLDIGGQLDLSPHSKIMLSPYISPFTSFWISGYQTFWDNKNNQYITDQEIYLKNDTTFRYNRYDIGILTGIDLKIKQPKHRFWIIGFRYEYSMLTTAKEEVYGWKNRNICFYIQYVYRIKK
jgi:hypothetical protein